MLTLGAESISPLPRRVNRTRETDPLRKSSDDLLLIQSSKCRRGYSASPIFTRSRVGPQQWFNSVTVKRVDV